MSPVARAWVVSRTCPLAAGGMDPCTLARSLALSTISNQPPLASSQRLTAATARACSFSSFSRKSTGGRWTRSRRPASLARRRWPRARRWIRRDVHARSAPDLRFAHSANSVSATTPPGVSAFPNSSSLSSRPVKKGLRGSGTFQRAPQNCCCFRAVSRGLSSSRGKADVVPPEHAALENPTGFDRGVDRIWQKCRKTGCANISPREGSWRLKRIKRQPHRCAATGGAGSSRYQSDHVLCRNETPVRAFWLPAEMRWICGRQNAAGSDRGWSSSTHCRNRLIGPSSTQTTQSQR